MNSSIFSFKMRAEFLKPFLSIIGFVAGSTVIECCLSFVHYDVPHVRDSELAHMAYYKPVRSEQIMAITKLEAFAGEQAEIVQVGDSSGLVAVKPDIVESYLPPGWRYLNASLQVPAQYDGFETMAESILRKDKKRRYLVGVFSLFNIGSDARASDGKSLRIMDRPGITCFTFRR